jgi:polyisoprenoid-binding protein YceI
MRLASFFIIAALLPAQPKTIDVHRSTITVHVGKSGVFSAAGHEHWVSAPIASGTITEGAAPAVTFKVNAKSMEVKPDPKVDSKTQAEVQQTMQEQVLESEKYPEISFRSSSVAKESNGQWKVEGTLTLHGVTKPVSISVESDGDAYVSHVEIRQSDFGIKPIKVAGGAVKVKDELGIDFHIVAASK